MARHKKLKPIDHKYLRDKKRQNIRKTVDYIYLAIMLISILVCGLNQFNDTIVGWGLILMGVISAPVAVFHIYADVCGWETVFWYDDPDFSNVVSSETKEKDRARDKVLRLIETVALILFSIGLPIEGVLKLLEK